jgi:DNA-directed RNA polymerase subunit M
MEFCPNCGNRLAPKQKIEKEKPVLMFVCPKCGYKREAIQVVPVPQKVVEHSPEEQIAVISRKEQKLRTLPTVRMECPRCKNTLAYVWQVQTRGMDESSTQFFRCTKCNHTYREYS